MRDIIKKTLQLGFAQRLSWVLHDECSMADLLTIHPRDDVAWVHKFIASVPNFKDLELTGRLEAFEAYRKDGGTLSFDEILGIIEARYMDQDLITINPDVEQFGVNNSPNSPYVRIGGQQYYARPVSNPLRQSVRLRKISACVAIFSGDQAAGHQESTVGVVSVFLWLFILARVADGQLAPVSQASAG
jgi:hypothetical protein